MPPLRFSVRLSRRILIVLALQAVALGLLATGALGTSKDSPSPGAPLVSTVVASAHDVSVPLASAPDVAVDPNRTILELERTPVSSVVSTTRDGALQSTPGGPSVPSTDQSFPGLSRTDIGAALVPPDPVGDVGPSQYVQAVNGGLAVFGKHGENLSGTVTDTSFWHGLTGCDPTVGLVNVTNGGITASRGPSLADPTINYDQYNDRWVYSEMTFVRSLPGDSDTASFPYGYRGPFNVCVAVSSSGDPTETWNRYVFSVGTNLSNPTDGTTNFLPDYGKLGIWPDGYYLSFNLFNISGNRWHGAGAMALESSKMLAGQSAQAVFQDLGSVHELGGGMLPSDADGATPPPAAAPNYYVSPIDDTTAANNDQLGVWAFHVDWTSPLSSTFTNVQNLNVQPYDGNAPSIPQPSVGGVASPSLDSLSVARLMNRLQYRNFGPNETLVVNQTVKANNLAAPRWYELQKAAGAWSVLQQSTYQPTLTNRWLGSTAMNQSGDIGLAYSTGDAATNPSIAFTGRVGADPTLSEMPLGEGTIVAGGGVQTDASLGYRWGDYSQLAVDPSDDCTFWYTGEYYAATAAINWNTRIGSFRLGGCSASAPRYTSVPVISGTMREGAALSATAGTWTPVQTTTAYQWRRCDSNGLSCTDIAGATSSSRTLAAADAGKRLRVKVTVDGTSSIMSAPTATVLPLVPANTVPPAVTGTLQMASTVSASPGTWTSAMTTSYAYQWQRCFSSCADIVGATAQAYPIVNQADVGATLRVSVTASNLGGSSLPVWSAQSTVIAPAPYPVNISLPTLTGTAQDTHTLAVSAGTWTGLTPITFTYQWQNCDSSGANCHPIAGKTQPSYTLSGSDIGTTVRAVVTATNSGGGASANTAVTTMVVPLPPVSGEPLPLLSGSALVGSVLSTTNGTWSGATPITYSYQWQACAPSCSNIPGATGPSYSVTGANVAATLRAVVTATNSGGSTSAMTAMSTAVPAPAPTLVLAPTVSGAPKQGQVLTVTDGSWSALGTVTYTYAWQTCAADGSSCQVVPGSSAATYALGAADVGTTLRALVTATTNGGSATAFSAATTVVLPLPPSNTALATLIGSAVVGSSLVVTDGVWTGMGPIAFSYQWQSCNVSCSDIPGATSNRFDVSAAVQGATLRAVVTASNAGGATSVTTTPSALVPIPAPVNNGGGSGGGGGGTSGGGGSGLPDLVVTGFASNAAPLPGENVTFLLTVTDQNAKPAENLLVDISLPSGLQYVTSTSDRGAGCGLVSAAQLRCSLDWLSSDVLSGHLQITAKVVAAGEQTLTAVASAAQGEFNAADNTLSVVVNGAAPKSVSGAPVGLNGDGTPTKAEDKKKPASTALSSTGARGRAAKLRFKVYDDNGVAKVLATVRRNGTTVGTASTGYGPVAYGSVYYLGWQVPAKAVKGNYSFCVVALDRAGNKSAQSCAPLTLK